MSLRLLAVGACLVGVALLCAAASHGATATLERPHRLILYSVAEQEQYINNADDLSRGLGRNPFGNYTDQAPLAHMSRAGPFPGDEALYSFNLYTTTSRGTRAGVAVFTCQYNFDRNAFCDVSFQLSDGGTLLASGAFNFAASRFSLAVTGGYGRYVDVRGSVLETPSSNHMQKLSFRLY